MLKTNPLTNKIKGLNGEAVIGSFYEKELLLSKLYVSYYPEPDSHIRDKVKVVLGLPSYATSDFISLKAEVDKQDIDVGKLKAVPIAPKK